MVKVFILMHKVNRERENGKRVRELDGLMDKMIRKMIEKNDLIKFINKIYNLYKIYKIFY